MAHTNPTLSDLATRGEISALEDRWLTALEAPAEYRRDLLNALEILTQNGQADESVTLALMWLGAAKETGEPTDLLALGRELILRCNGNDEMRREILRLYQQVYADRPEIHRLLDLSGLAGNKSPRRALRTLDICLGLNVGDHLLARSEELAARVTAIDADACEYTIQSSKGEQTLDADALAPVSYTHLTLPTN